MNIFLDLIFLFNWLVIFYFFSLNIIYAVLLISSYFAIRTYNFEYALAKGADLKRDLAKPFSILVPAYNESVVIVESVRSFLALDYPEYEVIVCNDGSKDDTLQKLIDNFSLQKVDFDRVERFESQPIRAVYFSELDSKLVVVDKVNGGKADALNAAANCSRYPYIGGVDSDSQLSSDSMEKIMQQFSAHPQNVAVGGIVRLSNGCTIKNGEISDIKMPKAFLEQIQVVEYLRAFLFGRMGWSAFDVLLIISGAFGIFRQDIMEKVGGWDSRAIGEDMDLVVRLHKHIRKNRLAHHLSFAPDPVCWTQAPGTLKDLSTQRDRWQRGLMQTMVDNRGLMFNPRYGRVGMVGFPYFFLYEMLGCVMEIAAIPLVIVSFILGIVNVHFFILFITVAIIWGLFLTFSSIFLEEVSYSRYKERGDLLKLFKAAFFENFGYRQIHSWWRFKGFVKYVFKVKSGWGTIKRV